MGYIACDDLIANMTPEQKIMISNFYSRFNNKSATNKKITNIELLYFMGSLGTSEFYTYNANKMYCSLYMFFSTDPPHIESAAPIVITLYDENNVANQFLNNQSSIFNVTEKFITGPVASINDIFSVITTTNTTYIKFIGYRITLI